MSNQNLGEKKRFSPNSNAQSFAIGAKDEGSWALPNSLQCNSWKQGPQISSLINSLDDSNGNRSLRSAGLHPAASKCIFLGREIFHAFAQHEEPDAL